jgi:hypothetical protein
MDSLIEWVANPEKRRNNLMTYEKPEALEIGSVQDVVLGEPKQVSTIDDEQLPRLADMQVAEMA